jgi:chromosome segregation ATPase
MDEYFSLQLLFPILATLISAVATYLVIIKKTRAELAAQTEHVLQSLMASTEQAEADKRAAIQELRQKIKACEADKGEMAARLVTAQTRIMVLETRVRLLEQLPH